MGSIFFILYGNNISDRLKAKLSSVVKNKEQLHSLYDLIIK